MRGSALIAGTLVLSLELGCTVRSLEDTAQEQSVNQCEASSDCRGGRCVEGQCVAVQGAIEKVLLEVVPPMVASDPGDSISSVRYLVEQELPEDVDDRLRLQLRPIVHVTGSVDYSYVEEQGCRLSDVDAVTLEARFTPAEQLLGLAATTYGTTVDLASLDGPVEFSLNVPPGYYDIYLKSTLGGITCQPTPRLIRRKPIGVSDDENAVPGDLPVGDVQIPFVLAPPSTLKVMILWPQSDPEAKDALAGWTLAMVDSNSGALLSGEDSIQGYDGTKYTIENFRYSPVEYATYAPDEVAADYELLRLAPPSDATARAVAPTLYASRAAAELWEGEARIALERLPEVVSVVGQVHLSEPSGMMCEAAPVSEMPLPEVENACAVPFSVQIISTSADHQTSTFNDSIPEGIVATYRTTVETEADLRFRVDLPVGEYRAIAIPVADEDRPWAISEDAWILGDADPEVHGKTVSVSPRARIDGRVLGAGSGVASGFAVNWSASPAAHPGTLVEATWRDAPVPRATSVSLAEDGSFSVFADAGVFNMTVKPEPESGFAWLVRPNITVPAFDSEPAKDLGDLRLPLPLRYEGVVESLALGGVVPDALIRAYVYLDKNGALTVDAAQASAVIQVGEARADADGEYQLLLPSELALDP